jgi:hypothetical protein
MNPDVENQGRRWAIEVAVSTALAFEEGNLDTLGVTTRHIFDDMWAQASQSGSLPDKEIMADIFRAYSFGLGVMLDAAHTALGSSTVEAKLETIQNIAIVGERNQQKNDQDDPV